MMKANSTEEPLKYFKDFFFENGYQKERERVISTWTIEKKKSPETTDLIITNVEIILNQLTDNEVGERTDLTTYFTELLEHSLRIEMTASKKSLREGLEKNFKDLDSYLHAQQIIIRDIKQTKKKLLENLPFCEVMLNELEQYIIGLYPKIKGSIDQSNTPQGTYVTPHENKNFEDEEYIQYSFFSPHEVKFKLLRQLHSALCEYGIIEELEDSEKGESQFIEIFSSHKPSDLNYAIKFRKKNQEVVQIFNVLKGHFNNLTPKNIEESHSFLKKSGKPFTANDINVANNKAKNNAKNVDSEVRSFIETLTKMILK